MTWEADALLQEQAAREEGRIRAGEHALALLARIPAVALGQLGPEALEVLTSARRCGWEPPRDRPPDPPAAAVALLRAWEALRPLGCHCGVNADDHRCPLCAVEVALDNPEAVRRRTA